MEQACIDEKKRNLEEQEAADSANLATNNTILAANNAILAPKARSRGRGSDKSWIIEGLK
jgi:hypothetical protein